LGVVALGLKVKNYFSARNHKQAELEKAKREKQKKKAIVAAELDFQHQTNRAKLSFFLQAEHHAQMQKLGVDQRDESQKRKSRKPLAGEAGGDIDVESYLFGRIYARRLRLVLAGVMSVLNTVVMTAFVGWFGSVLLGVGAIGFTAGAAVVGSAGVGAIAGVVIGTLLGIRDVVQLRYDQLAYEKKVREALDAPYMRTSEERENGKIVTNEEAFKKYFAEVESKKGNLQEHADTIKQRLGYDLNQIDVFNEHLFGQYEYELDTLGKIKKFFFHSDKITYSAQTGIFFARFLFLTSGVFVGAVTGMLPLLIVFAAITVAYTAITYTSYRLQRDQERNESFLNTLPERISYLKKKSKELDLVEELSKIQNDSPPDDPDRPRLPSEGDVASTQSGGVVPSEPERLLDGSPDTRSVSGSNLATTTDTKDVSGLQQPATLFATGRKLAKEMERAMPAQTVKCLLTDSECATKIVP
jgi:hypothetical protein